MVVPKGLKAYKNLPQRKRRPISPGKTEQEVSSVGGSAMIKYRSALLSMKERVGDLVNSYSNKSKITPAEISKAIRVIVDKFIVECNLQS
jgi:hypothetical protein